MCCCKQRMFTLETGNQKPEIQNNSEDNCVETCRFGKTFGEFKFELSTNTTEQELIKIVILLAAHYFKCNYVPNSFP